MNLAAMIDHTCLRPDATGDDIENLCREAIEHGFHSVCVAPSRVELAVARVAASDVRVCSVVGFPHGNTIGPTKGIEAEAMLGAGAWEIDMVMNIGALKDGEDGVVAADIGIVADIVDSRPGAILKVILETALLESDEIVRACRIAEHSGANFVKTSTGFGPGGATVEAVGIMKETVGDRLGVKASGGIRDYATAMAMIDAGATRLGTSSSLDIMAESE